MRPGRLVVGLAVLRDMLRRRPPAPGPDQDEVDPRRREAPRDPRAELAVAALLALAGLLFAAFAVLVAAHPQTQLLGAVLAAGLACLGVGLGLASRRVVVQEVSVEPRRPVDPTEDDAAVSELRAGLEGVTRRRALAGAAGVAGCGLAAALVLPVTGLGPGLGDAPNRTPWRRGRRLVDALTERPLRADDLEVGSFASALPEGVRAEDDLGASIVVVRVDPARLRLAPERRAWAPEGLLAFSQVCTHAGCAITLFRYPTYQQTSQGPALVCPCHYSTFDVTRAALPIFGPAVRRLPQLPLAIADDRTLVAAGPLSGSVGPSWWGVRQT